MAVNRFLLLLTLILATGAAASDRRPVPLDPDLLEFLGTFETAGGKDLDPIFLEGDNAARSVAGQKENHRPVVRKQAGKKTPPKERETNDE
jgi:hypothetical protein